MQLIDRYGLPQALDDKQKADLFTKDLDRMRFTQLASMIGMKSKPAQKNVLLALCAGAAGNRCKEFYIGDGVDFNELD